MYTCCLSLDWIWINIWGKRKTIFWSNFSCFDSKERIVLVLVEEALVTIAFHFFPRTCEYRREKVQYLIKKDKNAGGGLFAILTHLASRHHSPPLPRPLRQQISLSFLFGSSLDQQSWFYNVIKKDEKWKIENNNVELYSCLLVHDCEGKYQGNINTLFVMYVSMNAVQKFQLWYHIMSTKIHFNLYWRISSLFKKCIICSQ